MKHYSYSELKEYLHKKNNLLDRKAEFAVSKHLDTCRNCWLEWNKARWNAAKKKQGLIELREYLGVSFKWYLDSSWALAEEWNKRNRDKIREIEEFYKETKNYLYNLTIWHESGDRYPYIKDFDKIDKNYNIKSFVDFGCGIGSDGIAVLERNKKVYFYDFQSPSTDFLKWRGRKRKKKINLLYVNKVKSFPKVEMIWSIDVLEHMVNPLDVFRAFSDRTRFFVHESKFGDKNEGRHPFHFDFNINILNRELIKRGFTLRNNFSKLNFWTRE